LTLTSPTSGGRSVGIVRSRTEATELLLLLLVVVVVVVVVVVLEPVVLLHQGVGSDFTDQLGYDSQLLRTSTLNLTVTSQRTTSKSSNTFRVSGQVLIAGNVDGHSGGTAISAVPGML
jgi:hypothetical protein